MNNDIKTMSYEEAVAAKAAVEALDFGSVFKDDEIVDLVGELPLNERAVIAAGSFSRSYGSFGGLSFGMPSTKEVLQFDLEELDNRNRENVVIIKIYESVGNATAYGFYDTDTMRTIRTGRFK